MCSGMDRISCTTRTYDGHIFKKNGNWYQSFLLAPKDFKLYGFPIFDYERTWWKLFQKRVMRTQWDIYIIIKQV
jgi:hypothetical protein